jgi:hypothetical protein
MSVPPSFFVGWRLGTRACALLLLTLLLLLALLTLLLTLLTLLLFTLLLSLLTLLTLLFTLLLTLKMRPSFVNSFRTPSFNWSLNMELDLSADIIDVRDIIARVEELREEQEDATHDDDGNLRAESFADLCPVEAAELSTLEAILSELERNGGDVQWESGASREGSEATEGSWYPVTLIRDSYFEDYARELAEDIGAISHGVDTWPKNCIDWEEAASQLQNDYSSVEVNGTVYWYP